MTRSPIPSSDGTGARRGPPDRARDQCPRAAARRATAAPAAPHTEPRPAPAPHTEPRPISTAAPPAPHTEPRPISAATAAAPDTEPGSIGNATLARRTLAALVLGTALVTLLLAVPPLRGVVREIVDMNLAWVAVAVALEIASCASYVVIFRLFFDEVPAADAREVAWTEEASGALLPTGGLGALAIGGWLLRQAGMSMRTIVERSSALFFFTSGINAVVLVAAGTVFAAGATDGGTRLALGGAPVLFGVTAVCLTLAVPAMVRRSPAHRWPLWLIDIATGIDGARRALMPPNWRLLGALGYLGFDIAALGATFAATGHPIPVDALALGYLIGYLANLLPIPGGVGVLEAGLAGTLIAYGAPAIPAAAAVVVYHAIAFWIPSLGGLVAYARLRRRQAAAERSPTRELTLAHGPIGSEALRHERAA